MIVVPYQIRPSTIRGAGQGLFLGAPVQAGQCLIAPDGIDEIRPWPELLAHRDAAQLLPASVRWFEDRFSTVHNWPDECYVNHAFKPTGIWLLGFIFAAADLPADIELTTDYRHLLAEGDREEFQCEGRDIVGWPWRTSLRNSLQQLLATLS